ncbi:MAG: AAA family ATPase, partial [candidate division WOR-3 bacterium]|nr:AAA family ATPase [candidate division WOR-3 bacterium]
MIILITGKPRSGKTTLIKNIMNKLPNKLYGGFYTEEIRDANNNRIGFRKKTTDGKETLLADVNLNSQHRIGKYKVNIAGVESVALD